MVKKQQKDILNNTGYEFGEIKRCLIKFDRVRVVEPYETDIKTIESFVSELRITINECLTRVSSLDDDNLKRDLNTELACILESLHELVGHYVYNYTPTRRI